MTDQYDELIGHANQMAATAADLWDAYTRGVDVETMEQLQWALKQAEVAYVEWRGAQEVKEH